MRIRNAWIVGVLGLGLCGAAPALGEDGFPRPKRDFSADVAMKVDGGPEGSMESKGREYFGGGHRRREISVMGHETVVIQRADGTVWTLMPAQKMYMQASGGKPAKDSAPDPLADDRAKLEKVGRETVNGVEADEYSVTAPDMTGTAWMTSDGVPVRYDGRSTEGQTVRVDYTNHRFGTQEASLFELPAGYSALPSFGSGMGMPQGGAMPNEAEMKRKMDELRKQMEQMKRGAPKP